MSPFLHRLTELLEKYAVSSPEKWRWLPAEETSCLARAIEVGGVTVPLLSWRYQRRFMELRNMVRQQTVGRPLMCRFSAMVGRDGPSLAELLYRELDLAEWITGMRIDRMCFVGQDAWCSDGVVRLAGGSICSIELGRTLPPGTPRQSRHELVTRRGLACDLTIDTQVEQASVYGFTDSGTFQYTDVDAELFGLDAEEVAAVRAAFDVFKNPETIDTLVHQDQRLTRLATSALTSDLQPVLPAIGGGAA